MKYVMLEFVEVDGIVGYHYFNFIFINRVACNTNSDQYNYSV